MLILGMVDRVLYGFGVTKIIRHTNIIDINTTYGGISFRLFFVSSSIVFRSESKNDRRTIEEQSKNDRRTVVVDR